MSRELYLGNRRSEKSASWGVLMPSSLGLQALKRLCTVLCLCIGLYAQPSAAETIIERTVDIENISALTLKGSGDLVIEMGEKESLRIVGAQSVVDALSISAENQHLHILMSKSLPLWVLSSKKQLKYALTLNQLNYLNVKGGMNVNVNGVVEAERFELNATGSSNITVHHGLHVNKDATLKMTGAGELNIKNIEAQNLVLNMTGATNATLKGSVQKQHITLTGASNYYGQHLQSKQCASELNGASFADVWATEKLSVIGRGASNLEYAGSPELTQNLSGVSSISAKSIKP